MYGTAQSSLSSRSARNAGKSQCHFGLGLQAAPLQAGASSLSGSSGAVEDGHGEQGHARLARTPVTMISAVISCAACPVIVRTCW